MIVYIYIYVSFRILQEYEMLSDNKQHGNAVFFQLEIR